MKWPHHGAVLNQKRLGSCTGNALTQCLNCGPFWTRGRTRVEKDAVAVYSLATTLDDIPGSYTAPTWEDTGSSGLGVCKAGVKLGWIKSYGHAFGLEQARAALMLSPIIIGIAWKNAMFDPDPSSGLLSLAGGTAGGHEVCIMGYDADTDEFDLLNSWGPKWGQGGIAKLRGKDFGELLADDGDVTVPSMIVPGKPAKLA